MSRENPKPGSGPAEVHVVQRTDAVHVDAFLLEEFTLRQANALLHLRVRRDREARRLVSMGREACAQKSITGLSIWTQTRSGADANNGRAGFTDQKDKVI